MNMQHCPKQEQSQWYFTYQHPRAITLKDQVIVMSDDLGDVSTNEKAVYQYKKLSQSLKVMFKKVSTRRRCQQQ